jgi:riboflavin kinase / FMN adenylyltransferase
MPSSVVTVGTFDGLHQGHWVILEEVVRRARRGGHLAALVTFEPHPIQVLRPAEAPFVLTSLEEKKELLAQSGLDRVYFVAFTEALSMRTPEAFVREILVAEVGVTELVVGYDHGFGRGRSGDPEALREFGHVFGFTVDVVPPVPIGDAPVSSSRIRETLLSGDVAEAWRLLGRPYLLTGLVVRGEGRGARLGFPTANLRVQGRRKLIPSPGVYAVRVRFPYGMLAGALHVGPRPTFPGAKPSVELHVLDFEGDLYGSEVRVEFLQRIRGIEAFSGPDALVAQIRQDVAEARHQFHALRYRP